MYVGIIPNSIDWILIELVLFKNSNLTMDQILKWLEKSIEHFNYLKIMASPTLIGAFIGIVIYINKTDNLGLTIALIVTLSGIIGGILLANWAKRKTGTTEFISRVNASPDIDEAMKGKE